MDFLVGGLFINFNNFKYVVFFNRYYSIVTLNKKLLENKGEKIMSNKLSLTKLESLLFKAADVLRGKMEANEYKEYICNVIS